MPQYLRFFDMFTYAEKRVTPTFVWAMVHFSNEILGRLLHSHSSAEDADLHRVTSCRSNGRALRRWSPGIGVRVGSVGGKVLASECLSAYIRA